MRNIHVLRRRRDQQGERGAAAVEFALVLPILTVLLFAIITFGFLFAQDLALGNAARQTARYGVVETRTCGEVAAEAVAAAAPLVTLPNDGAHIVIERGVEGAGKSQICGNPADKPCAGSPTKANIYVTLNFTAQPMLPLPGMGSTVNLGGTGVFRCEWF